MTENLMAKLEGLVEQLTPDELDSYKLLLGLAAGRLAKDGLPQDSLKSRAFSVVTGSLSSFQPTGALWKGRPKFLDDKLLISLQTEAKRTRTSAVHHDRYFLGCGGTVADGFGTSKELDAFVKTFSPDAVPTGIASYLWYDQVGCGLDPHVDTEVFTLNVILMLEQSYLADPSHLLLYPHDRTPQRLRLLPGELLLLYAGGTIHAREDVKPGESICLLTVGFTPSA